MKKNIAYLIDSVLSKVLAFIPGVVIARYFTGNIANILAFAGVFSLSVSGLYMLLVSKTFKHKPDKRIESLRRQFLYSGDRYALDLFYAAFRKKSYVCTKNRKCIGVGGTALFCRFSPEELKADTLNEMYLFAHKRGFRRMLVLTMTPSAAALALAPALPGMRADMFDFMHVVALLDWLGEQPAITVPAPPPAAGLKAFLRAAASPNKANAYLLSGVLLLLLSQITAVSVYYIVFGSLLIALSLGIRLYARLCRRAAKSATPKA